MNYRKLTFAACYLGFLFLSACKDNVVGNFSDENYNTISEGNYDYIAYDSLGTVVAEGMLYFEFKDSTNITGEWEIKKVGDPQNIGPQIGSGKLVGGFSNETFWVALNPDVVDNSVFLQGKSEENKCTGKWEWITEAGPTNWGTFVAVKK
jgi:hypothetical protein